MINYRLKTVERAFTHQSNHQNMFLHLIFSPSEFDNFSGVCIAYYTLLLIQMDLMLRNVVCIDLNFGSDF